MKNLSALFLGALAVGQRKVASAAEYGVDCSFPVHNTEFRCGDLLGDRKTLYDEYMQGCRDFYGPIKGRECDAMEADRIDMSLRQPQSMVNYTSNGFMKIRAPEALRKLLIDYWDRNKERKTLEYWNTGNIYVNHWASPTYMISVEDGKLRGGGSGLRKSIWTAAKSTIEQWTGMELKETSMYGIRVYTEGAFLSPHPDRLPLVSSCIVNVAQDVDEPWPLEVFDRAGNAVNVTMEPGDMVLYESGSLIHGRPFPLKGRYFANIFIHFEPTGRPLYRDADYEFEWDSDLPPYLLQNSPWEEDWLNDNPYGWEKPAPSAAHAGGPEGHVAAAAGDLDRLSKLAVENRRALHHKDRNGWQPIHEAARAGQTKAVEMLIGLGVDINARTHDGKGGTPLNVAITTLSEKHPVSQYLINRGALNIGPEL